jgi:hypothetical protein
MSSRPMECDFKDNRDLDLLEATLNILLAVGSEVLPLR